jgi:hypothetical protein
MKKFLTCILTLWLISLIFLVGLTLNIKSIVLESTDIIIKDEITESLIDLIENEVDVDKEKIKKEINETLKENKNIRNLTETVYDKFLDTINGKTNQTKIDLTKELDSLINEGEIILNKYGITITEESKEEIKTIINSDEIQKFFNETLDEINEEMTEETKNNIKIFTYVTSTSFKLLITIFIIIAIVLIGILKKSYYKWLSNLGISLITTGIIFALLSTLILSIITEEIPGINPSFGINTFIITTIIMGIIMIITNIILTKYLKNNEENKIITEE